MKKALTKQVLSGKSPKSLLHRIANFLLIYRPTPHTTTGQSPSELFLKRQIRNRFTLLKPHLASKVEQKQAKQIEHHDKHRVCMREFFPEERVRVRHYRGGAEKWIIGLVIKRQGPLTYQVKVAGKIRFVHAEQMISAENENDKDQNITITPRGNTPVIIPNGPNISQHDNVPINAPGAMIKLSMISWPIMKVRLHQLINMKD